MTALQQFILASLLIGILIGRYLYLMVIDYLCLKYGHKWETDEFGHWCKRCGLLKHIGDKL